MDEDNKYELKIHKIICEFFRYLSFVSVCATLVIFIASLWMPYTISARFAMDSVITTGSILLASVLIAIIFTKGKKAK